MKSRPIPEILIELLRKQFPGVRMGDIEDDDVYLLMPDGYAYHYLAGEDFKTAIRVADSGIENLRTLVQGHGFKLTLLAPEE